LASDAITILNGLVFDELNPDSRLKADFAKKEMVVKQGELDDPSYSALAHQLSQPAVRTVAPPHGPPAKRPRTEGYPATNAWGQAAQKVAPPFQKQSAWGQQHHFQQHQHQQLPQHNQRVHQHHAVVGEGGEAIDTLACKVPPGQTAQDVESYFSTYPGFMAIKDNGSNCFVKFTTSPFAVSARDYAKAEGYLVDLARGNMKVGHEQSVHVGGPPQGASWTPAPAATAAAGGPIDTVACAKVPGQDIEMEAFFGALDGFVRLVSKPKNFFIKFDTPDDAVNAVETSKAQGYSADLARQNMVV